MADNRMFPVAPDFNLQDAVDRIAAIYRAQGLNATPIAVNQGFMIEINNGKTGLAKIIGLAANITVNMVVYNGGLYVSYTDVDRSGTLTAFFLGCFLLGIPWIPMLIGALRQYKLTKKLALDMGMTVNAMSYPSAYTQAPPPNFNQSNISGEYTQPPQPNFTQSNINSEYTQAPTQNYAEPQPQSTPSIPNIEYCRSCGATMSDSNAFCSNCGARKPETNDS